MSSDIVSKQPPNTQQDIHSIPQRDPSHDKLDVSDKSAFGSPLADKRKQSFGKVSSNLDRLYNKRIDFDRIAANQMSVQDKEDYLDMHIRRHAERAALPPPEQIDKNLKVVDNMR